MVVTIPHTPDELADHVYELLVSLDPARFGADATERCRALLAQAYAGGAAMLAAWSADPAVAPRDARLVDAVDGLVRVIPAPETVGPSDWQALRDALWRAYEALAGALRDEGVAAPRLRPTNWARSAVHLGAGVAALFAFELVLTPQTAVMAAAAWVAWAWSLELGRKRWPRLNELCMRAFGAIAHEQERTRVNSATWLGTALLVLTLTIPDHRGLLGLVAISVGDPFAGAVGRRYGRTKGLHGRSIEGSAAFATATLLAGLAYLRVFHPELGGAATLGLAAVAAVVGAVVEHVIVGVDDNLAVPLAVGAAVTAAQACM